MTYPPQQPGPYGQQNPWGQQPQGQFPPQQQPPSQAPPWLSGDPGGFPSFEPDPKKSRGGLIAVIIVVVLLVLGGGGVAVWLLMDKDKKDDTGGGGGGNTGDDARTVAENYVGELQVTLNTKLADIDLSTMEGLTCAEDFERMEKEIGDFQDSGEADGAPGDIKLVMKDFESTEEKGSFTMALTIGGSDGPDQKMTMGKEDGAWKVCGLYSSGSSEEPSSTEEPSEPSEPSGEAPNTGAPPNPIPTS
ncbi:hypothetical protein BLA60_09695 [Actinophytocola xinjiangensis]|uniref:DUF4878 domain-containing protein n=1 Tax=Actinophytocola xinjiangensis TaxID=485602 RepID=A0A7Z0WPZ0_9PSEU|nr:hypothetical protein [Actinophytocola xinjiangensis]OLF12252.1 hypothetical protein BLA60_09695 [Actinophytocola xinjiangensis]